MTDEPGATPPGDAAAEELSPPTTPAGWYPTPKGNQRYWDGTRWTDLQWDDADDAVSPSAQPLVARSQPWRPRRRSIVIAGVIILVIALVVAGLFVKSGIDTRAADAIAAAKTAKIHEAEEEAAAAKKAKDDADRKERAAQVPEIEASIKTMAKKDASDGVIDGPIIDVTCSPVNGGSTDDLTQLTTVFECFAADKNNSDGTQSGYYFNATMNWTTGSYTYGFGKPGD
jgi:Protein of unknown function (DUF2510)